MKNMLTGIFIDLILSLVLLLVMAATKIHKIKPKNLKELSYR